MFVPLLLPSTQNTALTSAMKLWFAGDFVGCLRELDAIAAQEQCNEWILLRARALLRLKHAKELIDLLSLRGDCFVGNDERATAAMLLGAGYALEHQFQRATVEFNRARKLRPHPSIQAETAYHRAFAFYQLGDAPAARAVLGEALKPSEDIIYVRAVTLSGFLLAAEEKFAEATDEFERALEALGRCSATDLWLRARIVLMIAIGQAEGVIVDSERVLRLVHEVPWTSDVILEHVQALRHVGLAFQRQANFAKAGACFVEAALVWPRSALGVMSLADRAWSAVLGSEAVSAESFKTLCLRVAELVDWTSVSGEARLALVDVAMLLARVGEPAQARRFMDLFDECPGFSSLEGLAHDSRAATFDRHARALVAAASGDHEHALRELRTVYKAWSGVRYHWRAIEAREDIFRLRPDRALRKAIDMQRTQLLSRQREVGDVARADSSPARASARGRAAWASVGLSPTQWDMLKLTYDGLGTEEIATRLGYTRQYVRKLFRQGIYPAFGLTHKPTPLKLLAKIHGDPALCESLAS